jgi:hypothetical protein
MKARMITMAAAAVLLAGQAHANHHEAGHAQTGAQQQEGMQGQQAGAQQQEGAQEQQATGAQQQEGAQEQQAGAQQQEGAQEQQAGAQQQEGAQEQQAGAQQQAGEATASVVGIIRSVEEDSFSLENRLGETHEFAIDENTKFMRGRSEISRDEISEGDQVRAAFREGPAGRLEATQVRLMPGAEGAQRQETGAPQETEAQGAQEQETGGAGAAGDAQGAEGGQDQGGAQGQAGGREQQ